MGNNIIICDRSPFNTAALEEPLLTLLVRSWVLIGEVKGSTLTSSLYIHACLYVGFLLTSVGFFSWCAGLSSHFSGLPFQVYQALYNLKNKKKRFPAKKPGLPKKKKTQPLWNRPTAFPVTFWGLLAITLAIIS